MKYVKGNSKDYVFSSAPIPEKNIPEYIEDYGKLSNEGLVEIFANRFQIDDKDLYNYILKKLSEKLNVRLSDVPLNNEEILEGMMK